MVRSLAALPVSVPAGAGLAGLAAAHRRKQKEEDEPP
jgi:hypothetical protein